MRKLVALLMACVLVGQSFAQAQNSYTLMGSARSNSSSDCYQLTPDRGGQTGAVWFDKRLNLTQSFDLAFSLNFGANVFGADGIVMVFQTQGQSVIGGSGNGIGYDGLSSSLGIEFDSNYNGEQGDLPADHVALMSNGVTDHRLNTAFPPPVPILITQTSVKDGRDHDVKVSWNAVKKVLRIEIDCVLRISQSVDLVNTIFPGTPEVYWGFTSATGSAHNAHTVCLQRVKARPDTVRACRSDQVTLTAPLSPNGQYQWSPAAGLDNPRIRTPRVKVSSSQLYTVQYVDRCGQPKVDSIFVSAKGPNLSIGADRRVCETETVTLTPALTSANIPVTYRWATGETTPQLNPKKSGVYILTVTADNCSVSDTVRVTVNPLPQLGLTTEPSYDCPGDQPVQLDPSAADSSGLRYVWTPGGSKGSTLSATTPGRYAVTVTTGEGCPTTRTFTILDNCPTAFIFVPDAFSPNGDGTNDVFAWKGESDLDVRMNVYNRWGEVVFASDGSAPFWDGTCSGVPCPPEVYTWQLDYRIRSGTKTKWINRKGRVVLIR